MSATGEEPGHSRGSPAEVERARSAEAASEERPHEGREERRRRGENMLPGRERRRSRLERLLVRLVATGGIVGIGVALGAILAASSTQGWIIGLVVALVSVILSAILWSSRQL